MPQRIEYQFVGSFGLTSTHFESNNLIDHVSHSFISNTAFIMEDDVLFFSFK